MTTNHNTSESLQGIGYTSTTYPTLEAAQAMCDRLNGGDREYRPRPICEGSRIHIISEYTLNGEFVGNL